MVSPFANAAQYMYSYEDPHDYWVVGFHRSGTNWLARMLMDVMGILDLERYVPIELLKVGRLHWHLHVPPGAHLNGGGQTVFIHRDPRDILVSMSLMWQHSLGDVEGVMAERVHREHRQTKPISTMEAIDKIYKHWIMDYPADCILSYYDLWMDTEGQLKRVVQMLGIDPVNDPSVVAARHTVEITVEKFRGGDGDQSPMSPAAGPGIRLWQDVLTRDQGMRIENVLGHWMRRLRYENYTFWHTYLPESR